MQPYLWISIGAVLGACARYFVAQCSTRLLSPSFPFATLFINVTGSFALGFFLVLTTDRILVDVRWRLLLAIGVCGSYTTFSSFAYESFALFEQGRWGPFAGNLLANNVLCLIATMLAAALARAL